MQSHYDFCRRLLRFPLLYRVILQGASQVAPVVKNPPANAGDTRDVGSIPGSGRSPRGGHGNSLQYSYLKNPVDRGAWRATVIELQRVTRDWTEAIERTRMHSLPCPATDMNKKDVVPAF